MYNAWKCSIGEELRNCDSKTTVFIPESVRQNVQVGRWRLSANLIRKPATTGKNGIIVGQLTTPTAAAAPVKPSPASGVLHWHLRLASGFELIFRLLAPGAATWAATPASLSRPDLEESASRWSRSVDLSRSGQARLRLLIGDFWTLIESLLPQKPDGKVDGDPRRPVTVAAIAQGLRERVRTSRDQMELRRRLLQLAIDSFVVVGTIVDVGKTPAWTTRVFKAAAAAGLDPGRVQTAFSMAAAANSSPKERRQQLNDSQLRQAWVRMLLEPFF